MERSILLAPVGTRPALYPPYRKQPTADQETTMTNNSTTTTNNNDSFYTDRKFCTTCDEYVSYLSSPVQCYCVQCGGEARIMSPQDWASFNHNRAKPTRRGKGKGKRAQAKTTQATVKTA